MTAEYVKRVLVRDLRVVKVQLEAYPEEARIWDLPGGVRNSAGTLAVHLAGNLRHFVGALLGGSDFVRDRAAEFAERGVPRSEILKSLDAAVQEVSAALEELGDDRMDEPFPGGFAGTNLSIGQTLLHLVAHFGYHLGQIDYHRRIVTGESRVAVEGQIAALVGD